MPDSYPQVYDSARVSRFVSRASVLQKSRAARCVNTDTALTETHLSEEVRMADSQLPEQSVLRQLLRYEPETGKLFWLPRTPDLFTDGAQPREWKCARWNSRYAGTEAFTAKSVGYGSGNIFGKTFPAHRVIWKHVTGEDARCVDHINGVRSDNRFCNLRSVSHLENMRNQRLHKTNTSGIAGVSWMPNAQRWQVHIRDGGRQVYLGRFASLDDAVATRRRAEAALGYHENHGKAVRHA